jgi:hypothetical protein
VNRQYSADIEQQTDNVNAKRCVTELSGENPDKDLNSRVKRVPWSGIRILTFYDVEGHPYQRKVLKRSKLNLWNVDEFLIYICFHWIKGDRMAFYQWGKENWETVPAKERIFSAPKQTAVIQTELDHILQGLEQTESQESLEDISEAASDVLAGYKYLIERKGDYRRTALKCAGQRLGEFKELCQEDMEEYLFSFKEEQKYAHGNVRVVYDAEQGIRIPAGTRFSQNVKNKDGRQETVWYTALETVSEEPLQELELDINVICARNDRVRISFLVISISFCFSICHNFVAENIVPSRISGRYSAFLSLMELSPQIRSSDGVYRYRYNEPPVLFSSSSFADRKLIFVFPTRFSPFKELSQT